MQGLSRQVRRALERRWAKEGRRSVPSPSSAFHDSEQERLRRPGKAFIPAANRYLYGFAEVNRDFLAIGQSLSVLGLCVQNGRPMASRASPASP